MNRRLRTFLRSVLILIVAIGPLQAQIVYACSMMDSVMTECCCDHHRIGEEHIGSDFDAAAEPGEEPCCEQSVEVQVDEDVRQDTQIVKPSELRSDVNPPQTIIISLSVIAAPQKPSAFVVYQSRSCTHSPGTDTFLITHRLRI